MAEVALTPTDFANRTMEAACSGTIPAAVGVIGAGLGLVALTPFLAPASLPMSVLGMVLARHNRNPHTMHCIPTFSWLVLCLSPGPYC